MTERSVTHAIFTLERTYPAAPKRVWDAFATAEGKARWFSGGEDWTPIRREFDFREGGEERAVGRWASGRVTDFHARYLDIVPLQRIVYAYEMRLDEQKISVSLATIALKPAGSGTRVVVTEQGAFLDGYEDKGAREHGTGVLLDRIGATLAPAQA